MQTNTSIPSMNSPTPDIKLIYSNDLDLTLDQFLHSSNIFLLHWRSNPAYILVGSYTTTNKKHEICFGSGFEFVLLSLKRTMEKLVKKDGGQCKLNVYYTEYHTDAANIHPSKLFSLKQLEKRKNNNK